MRGAGLRKLLSHRRQPEERESAVGAGVRAGLCVGKHWWATGERFSVPCS